MYPAIFHTKNAAKHFLTAVGDCIKGEKNNTYIVTSGLRDIMREIETAHYNCFGSTNILANFKMRYMDIVMIKHAFQNRVDTSTLRMPYELARYDDLFVLHHIIQIDMEIQIIL